MGRVSIRFFQPIATHLGHPEPGGFKLEPDLDASVPLRHVIASVNVRGLNLLNMLQSEKIVVMVAVNGRMDRSGLDAKVKDGDKVSIFPQIGGGAHSHPFLHIR